MNFHLSIEQAIQQLQNQKETPFTLLMKHGRMSIEYDAPKELDRQTAHKQGQFKKSEVCYLFRQEWNTVLKISLMILLPG